MALNEPAPYTITLDGRPGSRAEMVVNGVPLGEAILDLSGRFEVSVPSERIATGVNTLLFIRKSREPFALSRVRWTRPGEP